MVWPIIRGESYVDEIGKSTGVNELSTLRQDSCRNIGHLEMEIRGEVADNRREEEDLSAKQNAPDSI
jgi:hypothetical protein